MSAERAKQSEGEILANSASFHENLLEVISDYALYLEYLRLSNDINAGIDSSEVAPKIDALLCAFDEILVIASGLGVITYDPIIFTEQGLWYPERELETSGTDSQLASD